MGKPTENGWYEVTDSDSDVSIAYLHILPDGSIVWGWHENDDLEVLNDGVSFRKLTAEEIERHKTENDLNF